MISLTQYERSFKMKIFIRRNEIGCIEITAVTSTCARPRQFPFFNIFLNKFFSISPKKKEEKKVRVVTRNNSWITESKAFCRKMKNSAAF